MARGGGGSNMIGSLLKYGLLAGGGYWLWTKYGGSASDAIGGAGFSLDDLTAAIRRAFGSGTGNNNSIPGSGDTFTGGNAAKTLEQKLINAAQNEQAYKDGSGRMNAHQWNYFRNTLAPPPLTGEEFARAWDTDAKALALMTAAEFLAALHGVGLAGIRIPIPMYWRPEPGGAGRPVLVFAQKGARRVRV